MIDCKSCALYSKRLSHCEKGVVPAVKKTWSGGVKCETYRKAKGSK